MNVIKSPVKLFASIKAVITLFLHLSVKERYKYIVDRIALLNEDEIKEALHKVRSDFSKRHRNLEKIFSDNFEKINEHFPEDVSNFSIHRKSLLGAYFTKEYTIQAAALFNPSIVPHPDQSNLKKDELRFIMSLRATGEGHISSVCFQTGIANKNGSITLENASPYYTRLTKNEEAGYEKQFLKKIAATIPGLDITLVDTLSEDFTATDAINILEKNGVTKSSIAHLKEILDTNYELENSSHLPINEKVIFPYSKAECMGMEDVRFVRFKDGEHICYYGTYTAYNGKDINTQIIETTDFNIFKIRTLNGTAISDKGMALFPEKINGKYVMTSRQGAEKLSIMFSDDLYQWDSYKLLLEPHYPWETVQMGNCGSPVKTDKGWLLLTHGVGAMRTYVISAILLSLNDPSIIVGRLDKPFLWADEDEREGYVPNVVYTCGFMRHGDLLIIPYAVSDYATRFATIDLNEILNEMKPFNL
ncbi:MAG TPA: glycoside hydrolase family 130 protein [Chitinophagaceae bacterium]|nr:glycoside hydrolase family 130 protein [Chitinophagaceae bacterium]